MTHICTELLGIGAPRRSALRAFAQSSSRAVRCCADAQGVTRGGRGRRWVASRWGSR
jgi:hypothetical protein